MALVKPRSTAENHWTGLQAELVVMASPDIADDPQATVVLEFL